MFCHICEKGNLQLALGYEKLSRTTSDCKPWISGGEIGVCSNCGTVQKPLDTKWHEESQKVYSEYDIYHQSSTGQEQPIYFSSLDAWVTRSEAILTYIKSSKVANLLEGKRVAMDIGCGNGATLRAMAKVFPEYERYGFDPTANNIHSLKANLDLKLSGCSDNINDLPQKYDLLTMVHVLEHIPKPVSVVKSYTEMLSDHGVFLIVVPNCMENPFDITIVDHCTHFSAETLCKLLLASGLEVVDLSLTAIPKEILVICRKSHNMNYEFKNDSITFEHSYKNLTKQVAWLQKVEEEAQMLSNMDKRFGIFGTSIAGNWMYGQCQEKVKYFVDEDPDRLGSIYRGIPVLSINDLTQDDNLYIVLPRYVAEKIKDRYVHANCSIHITPEYIT